MRDAEQSRKLGEIITKAWRDKEFRKRLLTDTMPVLRENGFSVQEGVTVKAVQNTNKTMYLVIPPAPAKKSDSTTPHSAVAAAAGCCPFSQETQECDLNCDDEDCD